MSNNKNNIKKHLPFLIILILGTLYAINRRQSSPGFQQESGSIFGTVYHVTYQCDSSLKTEIEQEMKKVDFSLSPFNKSSIITQINNNEKVIPDSLFIHVFNLSKQVSEQTKGAFDITVAPLVNAWGFGFKNAENITPELIDSLRSFVGFDMVELSQDHQIVKQDPRITLDCSAIAKGYGSDVVANFFNTKGINNYMIEIGGEIVVKGHNPKERKWRVGINKPIDDSLSTRTEIQTILEITDCAMATSGNYRNFYFKDGKKYAHTINPHTGYPVQHSILSATVIAPDCATADAYATSFMVMGLDGTKEILKQRPELQAYIIYSDEKGENEIYMTEGIKDFIIP
ncbi:MAG: FAD:protein FMN transferase [Paraprevotella sp.]|nr:FAD:protein FMN transferase [Paraprevotella sp.]